MSVAGIILLLAFVVGVATIIAWPFLVGGRSEADTAEVTATEPGADYAAEVAALQAAHEALLVAVRDLDFDHRLGKLTEEDYAEQRESLMLSGVAILKRIDARQSDAIEQAVNERRAALTRKRARA